MSRVNSLWLLSLGALVVLISAVYLAPLSNLTTLMVDVTLSILASSPTAYHSINNVTCVGTRKPGVDHFLNIFYGEDTAGPNRFAPPVPVHLEKGTVIDATRARAWCPKGPEKYFLLRAAS
ncbi:hypothetical protein F4801DRAFT_301179 [Xylaria longipes]|nr:hypothetical protein F4801DRAFT_301179 [Xylaria longipes]